MQGKQTSSNLERKGPHKSMHCKFCKPPGVVTPEKSTRAQLETKTKMHLAHEAADLKLFQVHDEPGFPAVDSEACICILEGENPCPKCVPDKKRGPVKKKTCRCPKGAKPHPNMYAGTTPKKEKKKTEDDEFWWEKYSREHDARTKETWAAYMNQRRKEKKLLKCQKREQEEMIRKKSKGIPVWYQKLSCQQMIYVEFLSTAIRLDSDENITDRTNFVLGGIGLYPRPKRKILKKCLSFCHYNSIQFLNQLHLLITNDDPFKEKVSTLTEEYSWNDQLIMSSMCHLEFPALLRELMDRLPPMPREKILPQIPYPVFPKLPKKVYDNPYEEPIWQDRLNWVEKQKIDRLNRCRAHMDTKRVKIPPLALVRRPSLIDARPPFLNQIEANERASRRIVKEKEKRGFRRHPVSTFNSAVDVTAIANIEASEISTTDKADTDEICVFLREPNKEIETAEEEDIAEEEPSAEKEVKFLHEPETLATEMDRLKTLSEFGEYSADEREEELGEDEKNYMLPEQQCLPPSGSPDDLDEEAKKELAKLDEDLCKFRLLISSSSQTVDLEEEENLENLEPEIKSESKKKLVGTKKVKAKKKIKRKKAMPVKKKCKKLKKKGKPRLLKKPGKSTTQIVNLFNYPKKDTGEEEEEEEEEGSKEDQQEEEAEEYDGFDFEAKMNLGEKAEKEKLSKVESESSDSDSEDIWSSRPPCTPEQIKVEKKIKKKRKGKGKLRRRKKNKKRGKEKKKVLELREESQEYIKQREEVVKTEKETMTECYEGQYDYLYEKDKDQKKNETNEDGGNLFTGNILPVLKSILNDLADEGYISATYSNIEKHPDIDQLILYLKGEILTKESRNFFHIITKNKWTKMKGLVKFQIPELGLPPKMTASATWNDKIYVSKVAKAKKDEFYFKIAKSRADFGKELYNTLYQCYFGTGRYLKIYYAYMTAKYEDAILRGIQ